MGPIGIQEMIAIFLIALLLFGPKKLPELGRTLGKALSEFRRAKNELKTTFEGHLRELERETRVDLEPTYKSLESGSSSSTYRYPYDTTYEGSSYDSTSSTYGSESGDTYPSEPPVASVPQQLEGTVARSNGDHPTAPVAVPPEGEHSA